MGPSDGLVSPNPNDVFSIGNIFSFYYYDDLTVKLRREGKDCLTCVFAVLNGYNKKEKKILLLISL